ncbi:MAG TPA: hypothetical protein VH592_04590 [Gemmataceae bacterium]|jgi:Ca2+-binding EF-hand superfamily protein
MKEAAVALYLCLASCSAWTMEETKQESADPVLLLPRDQEPFRIRLDVSVDGRPSTTAWGNFLDRLFDFFDRDGDGSLSRAEVSRMLPLPVPGGKELTIDLDKLDVDGNGKGSREELKAFCRNHGFGPVIVVVEPPPAADLQLTELFLRRLDSDRDGKLAGTEWRHAPQAFRKYDLNEDEYLNLAELLASAMPRPQTSRAQVRLSQHGKEPDAVLHLDVGAKTETTRITGKDAKSLRFVTASVPGIVQRLYGPEGRWSMVFRLQRMMPDIVSAREFLVAQFKAVLGERVALAKADVEQDPALSGLLELFPYADRNADYQLSLAELEQYLKLVERGMAAQIWIKVVDHDRNPFFFLDTDGDGRLSYQELARASGLMSRDVAEGMGLPRQFQLSFGGPTVKSWGGAPIPAVAKRPHSGSANTTRAPRWFQVMDRNGDGLLSPGEFVGPPEVLHKLDADGDGMVSPEEARRAGNR